MRQLYLSIHRDPRNYEIFTRNENLMNFSFRRSKSKVFKKEFIIPSVKAHLQNGKKGDLVKRKKIKSPLLENDRMIPKRPYYHSRTNLPMNKDEWDYDSDDYSDDDWLHETSKEVSINSLIMQLNRRNMSRLFIQH